MQCEPLQFTVRFESLFWPFSLFVSSIIFFYLARQSKSETKTTNLLVQVLSICQLSKENHSITDLGSGCAKLYYQF